jgi:hypothetical protein
MEGPDGAAIAKGSATQTDYLTPLLSPRQPLMNGGGASPEICALATLASSQRHPTLPYDEPITQLSSIGVRSSGTHQPGPQEGEDHRGGRGGRGAFAKEQLPVSFVPSCSRPKKRRKSSACGHSPGAHPRPDIELGLLRSRPDRPAGDRCGSIKTAGRIAGAAVVLGARRGGVVLPLLVIPLTIPLLIFGSAGLGALVMGFSPSRVSCCSGDALGGRAGFPIGGRRTPRSRISRLDRLRKDKTPDVVLASGQCIPPL